MGEGVGRVWGGCKGCRDVCGSCGGGVGGGVGEVFGRCGV